MSLSLRSSRPGVGDFIRLTRTRKQLSQRELSALIGRSPAYVSKVEKGMIEPSFQALCQLAEALGLNILEVWVLTRVALWECHTPLSDSVESEPEDVSL